MAVAAVDQEREVVDSVRIDDAWALVEEYASLVRESGTDEEREAVGRITTRLDAWNVPYTLHEPELLISLPRGAALTVGRPGTTSPRRRAWRARPGPSGETAPIVYEPTGFAQDVNDIFSGAHGAGDVAGKFVVTEGLPMPGKVADIEARGARGGRLHRAGRADPRGHLHHDLGLARPRLDGRAQPAIPIVSRVEPPTGQRLIEQLAAAASAASPISTELDTGWRPIPVLVAEIDGHGRARRVRAAARPSRLAGTSASATTPPATRRCSSWRASSGEHRDALKRTRADRLVGGPLARPLRRLDLVRRRVRARPRRATASATSTATRPAAAGRRRLRGRRLDGRGRGRSRRSAIRDFTGQRVGAGAHRCAPATYSFNNLGLSTFFMLSSTMPDDLREEKGYYAVGGCGGNIAWHTEDGHAGDRRPGPPAARHAPLRGLDLPRGERARPPTRLPGDRGADRGGARRDRRAGRRARRAQRDAGATQALRSALDALYAAADKADSIEAARPLNDALLKIGRALVRVLYSRAGRTGRTRR